MNIDGLRVAINQAGLGRLTSEIERLVLPAIEIDAVSLADEELPVGASKIGGQPDRPLDVAWPRRGDIPLTFLAQYNLADVTPTDDEQALPSSGMLYFFHDFGADSWGLESADRTGWRVWYLNGECRQIRVAYPSTLPTRDTLPAHRLTFSSTVTFRQDFKLITQMRLADDEWEPFHVLCNQTYASSHQMLGHPFLIHYGGMPLLRELLFIRPYTRRLATSRPVLRPKRSTRQRIL
jgi:hypothetical protein